MHLQTLDLLCSKAWSLLVIISIADAPQTHCGVSRGCTSTCRAFISCSTVGGIQVCTEHAN